MPVAKLSAVAVRNAKPGVGRDGKSAVRRYGDGNGLWLQVGPSGGKAWLFRYKIDGKARLMGLGPVDVVPLANARDAALQCRRLLLEGRDPLVERQAAKAKAANQKPIEVETVRMIATAYLAAHGDSWRNPKHRQQWVNTLEVYVLPIIGEMVPANVKTTDVLRVLQPIWTAKPETASRVRGRIELVLDAAAARGLRSGDNPARWRGHLDKLLPAKSKVVKVEHHPALPWADLPEFMRKLRKQSGVAARALEFTILTGARTSEAIGARWPEIDPLAATWTVPAARMKAHREHRVPLSEAAAAILQAMLPVRQYQDGPVFPGARYGSGLSSAGMSSVLLRMSRPDLTVHGFRSSFRDWCAEATAFPREIAEAALAHTVRDKTEAAYQRGDLLVKRRRLMADWAAFCDRPAEAVSVIPIRGTE